VAFVLFKDTGFKGGRLRLSISNKQEVVNVSKDNCFSTLVNKDTQISFDRVEVDEGKKASELLVLETRGATEAVQGFVKLSVPTVK
jgi:predicted lactoylglutathione lyase